MPLHVSRYSSTAFWRFIQNREKISAHQAANIAGEAIPRFALFRGKGDDYSAMGPRMPHRPSSATPTEASHAFGAANTACAQPF
jgi:hypothetical protein